MEFLHNILFFCFFFQILPPEIFTEVSSIIPSGNLPGIPFGILTVIPSYLQGFFLISQSIRTEINTGIPWIGLGIPFIVSPGVLKETSGILPRICFQDSSQDTSNSFFGDLNGKS